MVVWTGSPGPTCGSGQGNTVSLPVPRRLIRPLNSHLHRLSALQTYARENALPVPSLVELHHAALTIGLDRIEAGAAPFPGPTGYRASSTVAR